MCTTGLLAISMLRFWSHTQVKHIKLVKNGHKRTKTGQFVTKRSKSGKKGVKNVKKLVNSIIGSSNGLKKIKSIQNILFGGQLAVSRAI